MHASANDKAAARNIIITGCARSAVGVSAGTPVAAAPRRVAKRRERDAQTEEGEEDDAPDCFRLVEIVSRLARKTEIQIVCEFEEPGEDQPWACDDAHWDLGISRDAYKQAFVEGVDVALDWIRQNAQHEAELGYVKRERRQRHGQYK